MKSDNVLKTFWKNRPRAIAVIEKALTREGLLSNKPPESIGRKLDYAKKIAAPSEHFKFPHDSVFLSDPKRRASYLFRAATDSEFAAAINRDREIIMSCPLGPLMGAPPRNFRDSVLRRLMEEGVFTLENSNDPKIETAAFLMERALNSKDVLYTYVPAFDFDEFHAYQSKIGRIIDKNLPKTASQFESFLADKKLKAPIKHALKVAVFENYDFESVRKISKKVRIPYETLRSRLKMGKKILKTHFTDLIPLDQKPKVPKPRYRERQFRGFYFRSHARKIHPVYKIDPITGARRLDLSRIGKPYKDLKKTPQRGFTRNQAIFEAAMYASAYDSLWSTKDLKKIGGSVEYSAFIKPPTRIRNQKRLKPVKNDRVAPKI